MQVDPRGVRFAAAITTVVLALVLVTGAAWLLAAQVLVFALGAFAGPQLQPYGRLFAATVRPRIGPPAELEDARPPRFAQLVGLLFATVGLIGFAAGLDAVAFGAVALATAAAFLNAAFGYCLGCEMYLLGRRVLSRPQAALVD
jgi:hypothetical protein